ncbi:hypothetical protein [Hydrogenimonas cancrithermarum]|uniref:Uncharacterized protein n=1 Tax=Hydrogenimonas cancrithermarum TaxID=2993563 RepID=A0ABM8FK70_9BACT|nr:hypothetical protein [Hydrogenimonas cancrithermarum]BDY12699.1 hypothetical protein HCR_10110 [Hydrogenimonas cancrithermarum]
MTSHIQSISVIKPTFFIQFPEYLRKEELKAALASRDSRRIAKAEARVAAWERGRGDILSASSNARDAIKQKIALNEQV